MRNNKGFTEHEMDVAVRVLMKSKIVRKWVIGEAAAFNVSLDTPEGKLFYERKAEEQAQRLVK